jgi:hypothetical protein
MIVASWEKLYGEVPEVFGRDSRNRHQMPELRLGPRSVGSGDCHRAGRGLGPSAAGDAELGERTVGRRDYE